MFRGPLTDLTTPRHTGRWRASVSTGSSPLSPLFAAFSFLFLFSSSFFLLPRTCWFSAKELRSNRGWIFALTIVQTVQMVSLFPARHTPAPLCVSLSLVANLGRLTWAKCRNRKSSATHFYQCVQYFPLSKQWYMAAGVWVVILTCTQLLMHVIVHGGCINTVRERENTNTNVLMNRPWGEWNE